MDELGVSDTERKVYGDIISHEGGSKLDYVEETDSITEEQIKTPVMSGVTTKTLDAFRDGQYRERLNELGITDDMQTSDLSKKQRIGMYQLIFDEVFDGNSAKNNGLTTGRQFLDDIGNSEVAAAIGDTIFRKGEPGGARLIQETVNKYYEKNKINKSIAEDNYGFGSESYGAVREIAASPKARKEFLDLLAKRRRISHKKSKHFTGEAFRADFHRLNR